MIQNLKLSRGLSWRGQSPQVIIVKSQSSSPSSLLGAHIFFFCEYFGCLQNIPASTNRLCRTTGLVSIAPSRSAHTFESIVVVQKDLSFVCWREKFYFLKKESYINSREQSPKYHHFASTACHHHAEHQLWPEQQHLPRGLRQVRLS